MPSNTSQEILFLDSSRKRACGDRSQSSVKPTQAEVGIHEILSEWLGSVRNVVGKTMN